MTTPAQISGSNFVTDWPVQGPTDPGMRAADCAWANKHLPAHPGCVDCGGGLIPMNVHPGLSGVVVRRGFLGGADIYGTLSADQQAWIAAALTTLNNKIVATSGSSCSTWAPAIGPATGCFKLWYNTNYAAPKGTAAPLSQDSNFDQDTLSALLSVVAQNPADFPTPYPSALAPSKKLSKGAMIGIGALGAAALGGIVYASTKKTKKSKRRR